MPSPKTLALIAAGAMTAAAPAAAALAAGRDVAGPPSSATALRAPLAGERAVTVQMRREGRALAAHRRLVDTHAALAARLAHARHHRPDPALRVRTAGWSDARLSADTRHLRSALAAATAAPVSPQLQAIANCESHGDPRAIGGGGAFRGKYQFDYGTWASVGGHGDPAAAPETEQDRRAALLLKRSGTSPWPVCGR